MPHMGQGPPKSSKRYISDLFEKSVPNMVTYLCKVLSQLHFPKNAVFCLCGLIAHAPYGPGTPEKFKKVHK